MYSQECLVGMCRLVLQILTLFQTKKCYSKILKIGPGLNNFSKALFEGLIFGGAFIRRGLSTEGNLRFKIDWASLINGRKFTVFSLFYFVFEGNFQVQAPQGLIFGGAYFWNFTVFSTPGVFRRSLWPLKSIPVFKPGIGRI